MSAGAIKAGQGFLELFLKSDKLDAGLKTVAKRIAKFSLGIGAVGTSLAGFGASITGPLIAMARHAADTGDAIRDMSIRTGVSTNALSELGFAAEQSGTDIGTIEGSIRKMQKALNSKTGAKALNAIGISLKELQGLSPDKQLEIIGDRIAKIEDPAKRTSAWLSIFGKQGTALGPLFENGAAGLRAMREEAIQLGRSISQEDADAADAYNDSWNALMSTFTSVKQVIGSALLPLLTELNTIAVEYVKPIIEAIKNNKDLIVSIFKVAGVIGIVGTVLAGVAAAGLTLAGVVAGLVAGWAALGTIVSGAVSILSAIGAFLITPVGIAIAAVTALGVAFFTLTQTGRSMFASIINGFKAVFAWSKAVIGGIFNAIMAGNWKLAGEIAMKALEVAWITGLTILKGVWVEFKFGVIEIFHSMIDGIKSYWNGFLDWFARRWYEIRDLVDPTYSHEMFKKDAGALREAGAKREKDRNDEATKRRAEAARQLAAENKPYVDRLIKAQQELNALQNQAAALRNKSKSGTPSSEDFYKNLKKIDAAKIEATMVASVGTSSGMAMMRLGQAAPGVQDKMLAAAETTNDKLDELIEAAKDGGLEWAN